MGGRRKRSKKQSDGKSTVQQRLRESSIFYVEESLSEIRAIHAVFEEAGLRYERHYAHFPRNESIPDHRWLTLVGERGWIALTKDKHLRYLRLEREAIKRYSIREFCFSSGSMNGDDMARVLRSNLDRMFRFLKKNKGPFVAGIMSDHVVLREDFSDEENV